MQMTDTMERLKQRMAELDLSAREVSMRATGTSDTVRNWLRRAEDGAMFSMRQDTLDRVCQVLGISTAWLLTGAEAAAAAPMAFAETSADYRPAATEADAVRSLYAKTAKHPAISLKLLVDLPRFDLHKGDLLITDLGREPRSGDLVAAHIEQPTGTDTRILRLIPPLLLCGDYTQDETPLRADQPGVTIRYPVIGCLRGTI